MDLINNNPFRIIGILSNASEKELQKQKGKITAYAKVGKEIESVLDFQILDNIVRTEDSIAKAFSSIAQNQDKVYNSLFWFLNASPFDNTAIEYLKNGDGEKAIEIWEKVTNDKDVNSKNYSAFNNLGTYKLLSKDKSEIKSGIEAKIKLIESEFFESYVHSVADETFTIDNKIQIEKLIDELLTQFINKFSSSETLQLFSGCSGTNQKYLSEKLTEEPIYKIESQIEICKKKRKENKESAFKLGLTLFTSTKNELTHLKYLLGLNDLKYKAVADQLGNEILQCSIDNFNESKKNNSNENYLESALKLSKIAESVAVGNLTKDRIKDSLATLGEVKDQEINQALQVLQSIKDTYEKKERDIYQLMTKEGISIEHFDTYQLMNVLEKLMNWNKVTEMLVNIIPKENINKIKNVQNTFKISEYKKLVDFLFDKIDSSNKIKIEYIYFWKTRKPEPEVSKLSEISFTDIIGETKEFFLGILIPTIVIGAAIGNHINDAGWIGAISLSIITAISTIIFMYSLEDIGKWKQYILKVISVSITLLFTFLMWGIDGFGYYIASVFGIVVFIFLANKGAFSK